MNPRPGQTPSPDRRILEVLDVIKGRWKGPIILLLRDGTQRFSALRRSMPAASARSLTESLRALERDGVIRREQFEAIPPRVEYSLTDHGHALTPLLDQIDAWGIDHLECVHHCRVAYDKQSTTKRKR
ncbi:MAG: helix-turn-helix domain-containing protein [Planctomycetota bacterium]